MDRQLMSEVMVALDATPQRIQQLQRMPFAQATEALEAIKSHARVQYKRLAFEWHPDRNQGDPRAEEKFKVLGSVLANLEKLRLQPPQRRVQYVHFPSVSPFGSSVSYTTDTSTTSATGYSAVRVAFIRVV